MTLANLNGTMNLSIILKNMYLTIEQGKDAVNFTFAIVGDWTPPQNESAVDLHSSAITSITLPYEEIGLANLRSGNSPLLNDIQIGRTLYLMSLKDRSYMSYSAKVTFFRGTIPFNEYDDRTNYISNKETYLLILSEYFRFTLGRSNAYHRPLTQSEFDQHCNEAFDKLEWQNKKSERPKYEKGILPSTLSSSSLLLLDKNSNAVGFNLAQKTFDRNNIIYFGTAGSGKNALYNQMLLKHLHNDSLALCIDTGFSLEKISTFTNGTYYRFEPHSPLFDPLEEITRLKDSTHDNEKTIELYFEVVVLMLNYIATDKEIDYLPILSTIKKLYSLGQEVNLESLHNNLTSEEHSLRYMLQQYICGEHKTLFSSNDKFSIDGQIVSFNLDELSHDQKLQSVCAEIILSIGYFKYSSLKDNRAKHIFLNEADFLYQTDCSALKRIVREGRKQNTTIGVSLNSYSDLHSNTLFQEITKYHYWMFITQCHHFEIAQLEKNTNLNLADTESLNSIKINPNAGETPFLLLRNGESSQYTLHSDPYTAAFICKHPEYEKLARHLISGHSNFPLEKLSKLVKKYYKTPQ